MNAIKVGDRVKIPEKNAAGEIAFIGETRFSSGIWFGVILDEAKGKYDGIVDGIRYFRCPKNHGIFVRARLIERESVETSDKREKQQKSMANSTKYTNYLKSNLKMKVENCLTASKSTDICKINSKNEDCKMRNKHVLNTNEKKSEVQKSKECTNKNDITYVLHSSSSTDRINYPNYLKASSKIKTGTHVCLAKNIDSSKTKYQSKKKGRDIFNNKSSINNCRRSLKVQTFEREIEELKSKLETAEESLQEILSKFDKSEREIINLKNETDRQKKQINYQGYRLKLLEMNFLNLFNTNKHFVSNFNDELNPSFNKFDLESIKSMISRQRVALEKQQEKTLAGLLEIKEFLNSRSNIINTDILSSSSHYPLKVKSNKAFVPTSDFVNSFRGLRNKASIIKESTPKSKENIDMSPKAAQFHVIR